MQSDFSNTYSQKHFEAEALVRSREYTKFIKGLRKMTDYTLHEASLFVPGDTEYQVYIQSSLKPFKNVKHVVLVGIGGSSLGTEAVYHALRTEKTPELHVIDSIEHDSIQHFSSLIKSTALNEIAVVILSKSGNTTETVLNATLVTELLVKRYGKDAVSRIIYVGNAETPLMKACEARGILTIAMPEIVGGRYSVFTAVGMVPLTLLKFDVSAMREGALSALTDANLKLIEKRAHTLVQHAKNGVHTVNFFTFTKRLSQIGYWYRQLLAESIGKGKTRAGEPFCNQLNPVVTTSADLHSIAELYLGGYKGIYTRFVSMRDAEAGTLPKKHWLTENVPSLLGKKVSAVTSAIQTGVLSAYREQKLPYESITLSTISPSEVGFLLSSLMCEVMYLGYIFEINPFEQPSVELYKKHTRTALQK
ncbi:MAG: hypothetical protein NUW00_01885 [Candidatus Kaiserbacteria bacterium]|nr:hypothetical protein [Candidatus Kaiserbacteria bacterium]